MAGKKRDASGKPKPTSPENGGVNGTSNGTNGRLVSWYISGRIPCVNAEGRGGIRVMAIPALVSSALRLLVAPEEFGVTIERRM